MPIRAIIFDIGEVLIYTNNGKGRKKWADRFGLKERELYSAISNAGGMVGPTSAATLGKVSVPELWQCVGMLYRLDDQQLRELQHDFWAFDHFNTELAQFLKSLRPRYKTATLSNAWLDAREAVNGKYRLHDFVDLMIYSAEEGYAKPDARLYHIALTRLGVQSEEVVFLDDAVRNVDAARLLGMRAIQFKNNTQAIAEVQEYLF
jgi:HAD superfamily hydrolase (TIGR01509 family)